MMRLIIYILRMVVVLLYDFSWIKQLINRNLRYLNITLYLNIYITYSVECNIDVVHCAILERIMSVIIFDANLVLLFILGKFWIHWGAPKESWSSIWRLRGGTWRCWHVPIRPGRSLRRCSEYVRIGLSPRALSSRGTFRVSRSWRREY